MASTEHFVEIHGRHQRLLARLIEQSRKDMWGSIGWRALIEGEDDWSVDELFVPLMQRGLIEDLTAVPDLGEKAGKYFVRITPLGKKCYELGFMLKDRHKGTEKEVDKYASELASIKPPQASPEVENRA